MHVSVKGGMLSPFVGDDFIAILVFVCVLGNDCCRLIKFLVRYLHVSSTRVADFDVVVPKFINLPCRQIWSCTLLESYTAAMHYLIKSNIGRYYNRVKYWPCTTNKSNMARYVSFFACGDFMKPLPALNGM